MFSLKQQFQTNTFCSHFPPQYILKYRKSLLITRYKYVNNSTRKEEAMQTHVLVAAL